MIPETEYYVAPSKEVFSDIKRAAIDIWKTYDDTHGYQSEKVNRIKDLQNLNDNYAYIVGMFDSHNQRKLLHGVTLIETKDLICRLIS